MIPFAAISAGLSALGSLASLDSQRKAKKEAKKANKEQAKREALMNLISVAGGGGTTGMSRPQEVPQVNYGGALSSMGGIADQIGTRNLAAEQTAYTSAQQEGQTTYDRGRQAKLDAAAQEAAASLKKLRDAQAKAIESGGSGSSGSRGGSVFGEQYRDNR